jgi:hypothetical protein
MAASYLLFCFQLLSDSVQKVALFHHLLLLRARLPLLFGSLVFISFAQACPGLVLLIPRLYQVVCLLIFILINDRAPIYFFKKIV